MASTSIKGDIVLKGEVQTVEKEVEVDNEKSLDAPSEAGSVQNPTIIKMTSVFGRQI